MPDYHLAQLNIAAMKFAMESSEMTGFANNLDRINELADQSPGFIWRLQSEIGNATEIRVFGANTLVNLSVWRDLDALQEFVYGEAHSSIMRRRREWFGRMAKAYMVLWWIPSTHLPGLDEASSRLELLQEQGPNPDAFTFNQSFPAPGSR